MKNLEIKNVWRACNKISAALFRVNLNLRDYFRVLDITNSGLVSEVKFISVLRGPLRYVVALSETEILELADYFRLHDGRIHYSQLCQIVHENVPKFQSKNFNTDLKWEDALAVNPLNNTELKKLNLIIIQIAMRVNRRKMILRPYFQDYELIAKNMGTVTITHFGRILNFLGIILAPDEFALLVKRFVKNFYTINYVSFVDAIEEAQNYIDRNGAVDIAGEYQYQFPGQIITTELPKQPRPEIGKVNPSEVFHKQSTFHSTFKEETAPMTILEAMQRIQRHVLERRIRVREFFQQFDTLNAGRVTVPQFKRGLDGIQVSSLGHLYLSETEIDIIADFYKNPNDPDYVLWRVFEDDVDHVFTVKELEKFPNLKVESPPTDIIELPKRGSKSWEHTDEKLRQLCEETLQKIRLRVEERRIILNRGHVSRNQIPQIFSAAMILLSAEEIFALEQRYNDEMGFNYALFLRELEAATTVIPFNESILPQTMRTSIAETLESQSNDENNDIALILTKIKAKVVRERIQVQDYLSQFDSRHSSTISRNDFIRGLDQMRCNLTPGQLETLMETFKAPLKLSGFIDYKRFCRTIQDSNSNSLESLIKSSLLVSVPYVPSSEAYSQAFLNSEERRSMAHAMNKIAKLQNQNLEEIFKDLDKRNSGTVTKNQLIKVFSVGKIMPLIGNTELNAIYKSFLIECPDRKLEMDYRSQRSAWSFSNLKIPDSKRKKYHQRNLQRIMAKMLLVVLACFLVLTAAENQEDYSKHPNCQLSDCPPGQVVNKTHPLDCTKYISCSNGNREIKTCPSGFKFNLAMHECEISIGGAGQGCIPCWEKRPDDE
ncbi:hypothetical protein PV327_004079 [Microctonus hyperodae]|uniref:Uncharacterized protein n=1 Tax=Microctonus hyperodae TaxID=165561 RepID=A0AA39KMB2_MICHY|nr:hypothetical protein PV327_004079 [Microctonus hyperodae]